MHYKLIRLHLKSIWEIRYSFSDWRKPIESTVRIPGGSPKGHQRVTSGQVVPHVPLYHSMYYHCTFCWALSCRCSESNGTSGMNGSVPLIRLGMLFLRIFFFLFQINFFFITLYINLYYKNNIRKKKCWLPILYMGCVIRISVFRI